MGHNQWRGPDRPPTLPSKVLSVRRLLALLLPLLLLVTACGAGTQAKAGNAPTASASVSVPPANAEALSSVKVADQGTKKPPTVTFAQPLKITAESMKVVKDGTGAPVKDGQILTFHEIALDPATGKTLAENFSKADGSSITLSEAFKSQFPLVYATFTAAKVGSYIAYGTPATPAVAATATAAAQPARPASMSVFQISGAKDVPKALSKPEGDTVNPPAGLATVKVNDKGVPQITIGNAKAPTALVAQDLIKGKGAVVKSTDTIVANYVGVNFVGGAVFDSSFDRGTPATFSLGQVIQGWTQGLTGKTVGSRVLLEVPKALAYGDTGKGAAKGDLVFVVDILGVQ